MSHVIFLVLLVLDTSQTMSMHQLTCQAVFTRCDGWWQGGNGNMSVAYVPIVIIGAGYLVNL